MTPLTLDLTQHHGNTSAPNLLSAIPWELLGILIAAGALFATVATAIESSKAKKRRAREEGKE